VGKELHPGIKIVDKDSKILVVHALKQAIYLDSKRKGANVLISQANNSFYRKGSDPFDKDLSNRIGFAAVTSKR